MVYMISMIVFAAICIVGLVVLIGTTYKLYQAKEAAEKRVAQKRETQFDSIVNHVLFTDKASQGKIEIDEVQLAKDTCVEMSKKGLIGMTPEEVYEVIKDYTNKRQFKFMKKDQAEKKKQNAVVALVNSFVLKPGQWKIGLTTVRDVEIRLVGHNYFRYIISFLHPDSPKVTIYVNEYKKVEIEYRNDDAKFLVEFIEHVQAMDEVSCLDNLDSIIGDK